MIYPLTIIADRYSGVYSGGEFTAFNLDFYKVPTDCADDDVTCCAFWTSNTMPVGLGDTPQEAMEDLERKINK